MQPLYLFVVGALAVWRITHLLNAEDGPWDLFVSLRRAVGNGFWGRLLDCFYCLSLWVAAPITFAVGSNWRECILLWPALSGAAILLERATGGSKAPPVAYFEEEKGD
jgi:hypothetical protein